MEHYLKPYGISEAAVRAALKDPDSTKDLNFPNFPVRLILKKSNGYYLLIDGRRKEQFIVLRAVFRIFPHTIEGLDTHDPLIILQHFAQQFGRTIFVGEQFNKFIYNSKFILPKTIQKNWIIKFEGPKPGQREKMLLDFLMSFNETPEHIHVDIDLAYLIDNSIYIRYLNENDPGSINIPEPFD